MALGSGSTLLSPAGERRRGDQAVIDAPAQKYACTRFQLLGRSRPAAGPDLPYSPDQTVSVQGWQLDIAERG
jgi:hypothetical protein